MYSLRYGTVPIVHGVGGLADTVADVLDAPLTRNGRGQGFVFHDYTAGALLDTLRRALVWFGRPDDWRAIQRCGMAVDYSWDRSAQEYVKIYEGAIAKRAR
jgi:starch synthase